MKIANIQKFSLIDYPGHISCVLFTQGCNFRCGYCHNPELVLPALFTKEISFDAVLDFLKSRKNKLEAVVITGGEPTIHEDLLYFCWEIKRMGFLLKLDTNGTNPKMLKKLITMRLVDHIAMDIKAPWDKYNIVTDVEAPIDNIKKSIKIIKESGLEHHFRTTFSEKMLNCADKDKIMQILPKNSPYIAQNFVNGPKILESFLSNNNNLVEK